jgi:hypothetical protein
MANNTLLHVHPPRNGQTGSDGGWSEEEYYDTVLYEEDLAGPDEWDDDDYDDYDDEEEDEDF